MNKREIVTHIIARLTTELESLTSAARATHAEATDEENKAEDKYDTRGLEASYLAHGQSKAAEEAAQSLGQFEALPIKDFSGGEPISLGALVTVEGSGSTAQYFIGPRAGGTELPLDGSTLLVITPHSPLGRQLMGKRAGDSVQLDLGGKKNVFRIETVA